MIINSKFNSTKCVDWKCHLNFNNNFMLNLIWSYKGDLGFGLWALDIIG